MDLTAIPESLFIQFPGIESLRELPETARKTNT